MARIALASSSVSDSTPRAWATSRANSCPVMDPTVAGRPPSAPVGTVRPTMPPLITPEEALALGRITDHAEIEALVERAWQARQDRFGDSTDLCSLVNAKSGGCAEDCGFCAQSKYAEAETPLHAMMEPEQMLEHEIGGAHV